MTVAIRGNASRGAKGKFRLEIWSLFESSHRATLNLPSITHEYRAQIYDHGPYVSDDSNPHLALYVPDPTAERIIVLSLNGDDPTATILVISVLEILKLMVSPPHLTAELSWSAWGPRSTRWFNDRKSGNLYVYKSMLFFSSHSIKDMSFGTGTILSEYDREDHTVILDFNQRSIKRERNDSKHVDTGDRDRSDPSATLDHFPTEMPTTTMTHLIDEEWAIRPFSCREDVKSCLPFRIIIGESLLGKGWGRDSFIVSKVSIFYTT